MDSVTLVHAPTTTDRRLAKAIVRAPADSGESVTIVQVDDLPYHCDFSEHRIDTLESVHTLLLRLANDVSTCVIRARPLVSSGRRLTHADPVTGDAATLEEVPRTWVAIDVDSVPEPEGLRFCVDPHKCAQHVRTLLPLAFRTAACVWHATGSAGFKSGIRLHLWFVLTEPVDGATLDRWFEGCPVDPCTFRANQPIFTADPVLVGGVLDPMLGGRLGILGGSPRVHVPDFPAVGTTGADTSIGAVADDPLKVAALARWSDANPTDLPCGTSERFECPACGSSDGIAVRADGKWNCHSSKHGERAALIGTWTGAVYVGHRIEFQCSLSAREVIPYLKREGHWITPRLPAHFVPAAELELPPPVVQVAAVARQYVSVSSQPVPEIRATLRPLATLARTDSSAAVESVKAPEPELEVAGEVETTAAPEPELEDTPVETTGAVETEPELEDSAAPAPVVDLGAFRDRKSAERALSTQASSKYERGTATVRALVFDIPAIRRAIVWDDRAHRVLVRYVPPWRLGDKRALPRPLSDTDGTDLCQYLHESRGYAYATRSECLACLETLALETPWDPVREYLEGLSWPGTAGEAWNFLGRVPREVLGVEGGDGAYITAAFARWSIAAVQRTYEPGCMYREVLTLIGEQNIGKSQFFRRLCANPEWFSDTVTADGSKDSRSALDGKWIVEFAELDKHMREDRSGAFKNYISTQVDTYRRSFGRMDADYRRRCVFAATSNHPDLFIDSSGNSRFNLLHVTAVELPLVESWRDRIWSAARCLYTAGEPAFLQPGELECARRLQSDAYAESSAEAIIRELWEAPAPAGTRRLRGAPDDIGFEFSSSQVGADGAWLVLTTGQMRDHLRIKGYAHNVDKLIRSTCRGMRLLQGRTSRELTGSPVRAWGRPEGVTVGAFSCDRTRP